MNEELYKLIEAYLNGTLPEAQRREVEQRMAGDEDFRREVELHRVMQEEFEDSRGWQLYSTMTEIMEEPPPEEPAPDTTDKQDRTNHKKWWWFIPFALILGGGIWYLIDSHHEAPVSPPAIPNHQPQAAPETPPAANPRPQASDAPVNPPVRPLIAQADPADFRPNASLEGLRSVRAEKAEIMMTSPKDSSTVFDPDSKGKTALRFTGVLKGLRPDAVETIQFNLLIFSNKDARKPLMTLPLPLKPSTDGNATFDLPLRVDFPRGLYYYRIEEAQTEMVLRVERFYVGRR